MVRSIREPWVPSLSLMAWVQIGIVAMLFVLLYWSNLRRLWLKTNLYNGTEGDNWSHSTLVPIIGLLYLWLKRKELLAQPVEPLLPLGPGAANRTRLFGGAALLLMASLGYGLLQLGPVVSMVGSIPAGYGESLMMGLILLAPLVLVLDWGLALLLGGILLFGYGIWPGQNDYLKDVGMIVSLFGAVLTLAGWKVMRYAAFPIVFLICALPWPGLVYSMVALPLQMLAAQVAVVVLNIAGVDSLVEGSRIVINTGGAEPPRTLNVAEACAGMRSLMTFITIATAMAFLQLSRPGWQKAVLVVSAVPIAIACNVARVSVQGLLDAYVSPEISQGFAHMFVGLVMLIPAFFLLLGVGWALDRVFIEEEDEPAPGRRQAAPSSASPVGGAA